MKDEKLQNYNFDLLSKKYPVLVKHLIEINGRVTIDFGNAKAVKALNKAILFQDYGLTSYKLPDGYLVPGVTGRRRYIDQVANLIGSKQGKGGNHKQRRIADIGVGGNCIYPIIGHRAYGWEFIGVDSDQDSVNIALDIITANDLLDGIGLRLQSHENQIIDGWITEDDYFDCMLCNPPFYSTEGEANLHSIRKINGLKHSKLSRTFGGKRHELITEGGEVGFVSRYIQESKEFASQVYYFTCLISSGAHLTKLEDQLKELKATERRVLETSTANKASRILVWSFLSTKQKDVWREYRWK